ncbi:MAG: bifunctional homocysteine S-methyltransferase/methylenetetrahydrofolate reductase [Dehalococcoidia bacterium]|nr:bifunctional homocysteine S-methyltransferase/methylenetetrahydrofolate reductase [Dehalococcoidia bacterium]
MAHPFLAALERRVLLADGAVGTLLRDRGVPASTCLDEQNLSNPEVVLAVHQDYVTAGAEIIETNTFGANRLRLRSFGLSEQVAEINARGVALAQEATRDCGHQAFVAGAIGPVGVGLASGGDVTLKQAHRAFAEQAGALVEAGVDLIMLETFATLAEAREAVLAVRQVAGDIPLVAQVTFQRDGRTWTGEEPADVARELHNAGADVVGVNCVPGPQTALEVIEEMSRATKVKLAVQPNAGHPRVVEREVAYPVTPHVFAEYVPRLVAAGCVIVGGCCGTTPEHIAAMRNALRAEPAPEAGAARAAPAAGEVWVPPSDLELEPEAATLRDKLAAGRFVVTVEIDPPRGLNPRRALKGAARLKAAGVDCINVGDSPMARVRMSPISMAVIFRQQLGLEPIVHVTTRDRNLLALQSDLIGAHVLGLRNVLCLRGDVPSGSGYARAVGVWDVTPVGLIRVLKGLNEGIDWAGNAMAQPTSFFVGAAANPTAPSLDAEIKLLRRKVEAGADFVMTQAVYDIEAVERFLEKASRFKVPVLLGVLPLHSERHAEFLHNELAGVVVPEGIRQRMREAGDQGLAEGAAIARELIAAARGGVQGLYLMPAFDRFDVVTELVQELQGEKVADPAGG